MTPRTPQPGPTAQDHHLSRLAARAHRRAVRRRRTKRVLVGGALLLVVGLTVAYLVRGPLTRRVALATLEETFGYRAACGRAELITRDRVRLPDLVLRAPGIEGPAGRVLEAKGIELVVDWARAVFDPEGAVSSVRLIEPVVRASIDVDTGVLNLGGVGREETDLPDSLPPIVVEGAEIVFGEHGDGWFAPLDRIRVNGVLAPQPDRTGVYALALRELVDDRDPAVLAGDLDLGAGKGELRLERVDFSALHDRSVAPPVETLLRKLRIDGLLPLAELRFAADGSFQASLALDGVDVRLPVPVLNPDAAGVGGAGPLEMDGVSGTLTLDQHGLRATLNGLFEDIDARVSIRTEGYSAASDVTAEVVVAEYHLRPDAAFLPYAPALAAELVERFSGPRATISGRVRVGRSGGEPEVSGLFVWEDGRVAFEEFPYPVTDISGRLTFDTSSVTVSALRGRGPSGAEISATVRASPPGESARIEAHVTATGVPIDDHLITALPAAHRRVIRGLLDESVLSPPAAERLALEDPAFVPGGDVRLEMEFTKGEGSSTPWRWGVTATSDALAVVPRSVPYPLRADAFRLELTHETAHAELGGLSGPTGLAGSASVDLPLTDGGPAVIGLDLGRVPLDELSLGALEPVAPAVAVRLERLGVAGEVSVRGEIEEPAAGEFIPDVRVALDAVSLGPVDEGRRGLRDLTGEIELSAGGVRASGIRGSADGAPLTLRGSSDASGSAWEIEATSPAGMLTPRLARLGDLLFDAGPESADGLGAFVTEWAPAGAVDAKLNVAGRPGEPVRWHAELGGLDSLSAEIRGRRLTLRDSTGTVGIDSRDGLLRARAVSARVVSPEGDSVALEAHGTYRFRGEEPADVVLRAKNLPLESPLTRRAVALFADERTLEAVEDADPAGLVDAELEVTAARAEPPVVRIELAPRSLEITQGGERVRFTHTGGRVVLGPGGAEFDALNLAAAGWEVSVRGAQPDGTEAAFNGEITLTASRVTPGLLAALPDEARGVISAIGLTIGDAGELRLRAQAPTGDAPARLELEFEDAGFEIGVPIDGADGRLELERDPGSGLVHGVLTLDVLRAARIPMTAGVAELTWDPGARTLTLPQLRARCRGGAVSGRARLAPAEGSQGQRAYFVDARAADVPLAWVLAHTAGDGAGAEDERGLIAGRLTLRGELGPRAGPRRGRGTFTVSRGEVVRFPLLTPALELVNLQAPVGEELDDAAIEFSLLGPRLTFDRLSVQSRSIVMSATGWADVTDGSLEIEIRSRGRRRWPVVSDLIDAFRHELVRTRVTGTLADPRYELMQLPNAGRVLLGVAFPGAGGRGAPEGPPPAPPRIKHVFSVLEPIDESSRE